MLLLSIATSSCFVVSGRELALDCARGIFILISWGVVETLINL